MARFFLIFSLLSAFFISQILVFAETLPPPDPPSAPISPTDGASTIQLTPLDSILELEWQPAQDATKYFYQYWKEGDPIPALEIMTPIARSELMPMTEVQPGVTLLQPGTKYFWRVRSCADNDCGNYSDNWSFTFLLDPPELISPTGNGVDLQVILRWQSVPGAQSYNSLFYLDNKCHPFLLTPATEGVSESCDPFTFGQETDFTDELCFFSKGNSYKWKMASCLDKKATAASCGEYGPRGSFGTNLDSTLEKPELTSPLYSAGTAENPEQILPPVNQSDKLAWLSPFCAYSYRIEIRKDGQNFLTATSADSLSFNDDKIKFLWAKPENFDKTYSWRVDSCWDLKGMQCQNNWSQPWFFKTTGATPVNLNSNVGAETALSWSWSQDSKVASYRYQVATDQNFSQITTNATTTLLTTTLQYPDILPDTAYWWRVKSCADTEGNLCGPWSGIETFTTPELEPPRDIRLGGGGGKLSWPRRLEWTPHPAVPKTQYIFEFGGQQISSDIVADDSVSLSIKQPGEYLARARSCWDPTCAGAYASAWTPSQIFQVEKPECKPSLVPCGRACDVPAEITPYDEMESCQIKHLGFTLQNIIDFLLWRLGIIVLGIFSIMTGAIAYFSLGSLGTLEQIKSIWKSAGIGYGIMFIAWVLVNSILALTGFQVQFFGRWFQLPF